METCVKCGAKHPKYVQDFLIVNRSSQGKYGRVVTTEQLAGAERHGICTKCLLKKVINRSLLTVLALTIGVFLVSVMIIGNDIPVGLFAVLSPSLGILAGILVAVAGMFSQKYRIGHLRKMVLEYAGNSKTDTIYIPVGDNLYQDQETFINRNGQFLTDVGKRLYSELIATDAWKEYVAATRNLTDASSNPMPKTEVPKGEHQELLSACVQELLRLYQQTPGGFLSDSAAAMPVRAIGQKLHEAGGFELMLEAHALFAARNPGMGLARNLEMIWDGVGNWRG